MYEHAEIVKTSDDGKLRVLLVHDIESPEKPDHDGQVPVLRFPHRDYTDSPEQEVGDAVHENLLDALTRWSNSRTDDRELFERYARAFHGATRFSYFRSSGDRNSPTWVAFDTAAWRETHGVSVEQITEESLGGDFKFYVDGEVFGVVVQKKVTWVKLDPTTDDVSYLETREEWEDVEDGALWGYYGEKYAREVAIENLTEAEGQA